MTETEARGWGKGACDCSDFREKAIAVLADLLDKERETVKAITDDLAQRQAADRAVYCMRSGAECDPSCQETTKTLVKIVQAINEYHRGLMGPLPTACIVKPSNVAGAVCDLLDKLADACDSREKARAEIARLNHDGEALHAHYRNSIKREHDTSESLDRACIERNRLREELVAIRSERNAEVARLTAELAAARPEPEPWEEGAIRFCDVERPGQTHMHGGVMQECKYCREVADLIYAKVAAYAREHPREVLKESTENVKAETTTAPTHVHLIEALNSAMESSTREADAMERIATALERAFPEPSNETNQIRFCSICGSDLRYCDHVPGRSYWGVFCHMLDKKPSLCDTCQYYLSYCSQSCIIGDSCISCGGYAPRENS